MALLRSRRLDAILGAPANMLTAEHIEALVSNQVQESFDLDFKASLYGNGGQERRDLCGDVAALANSSGGVILLGVEENGQAIATATPGVELGDSERNRMLQILAAGVAPLPAVDIMRVPRADDPEHGWWVLAVPRSRRAPHAVLVNGALRFPVRNGATIRYLSEPEVADEYRRRGHRAGEITARIADVVLGSWSSVDRDHGPWILIALVPEHPGALEISQMRWRQMQHEYGSRDLYDAVPSGGHFEWVRIGRGKYTAGDGPYPNATSQLPRYGYAELHTDGTGCYALRLIDMAESRRQSTGLPDDPAADQMVSDEAVALSLLTALRRLASHARDTTGAAGTASVQVHLAPSPGRTVLIGHTRQHGFANRRGTTVLSVPAVADSAASLDELADPGPALVAVAARLLDEVGTSFGIPEMGQYSLDGEVRRRYWRDASALAAWAERHDISLTESLIADAP